MNSGSGPARPAIAMLQTLPLPGSARYEGAPLAAIVTAALKDAEVLAEAGFDGLQLQNINDGPGTVRVGPEVVACLTAVGSAVRARFPGLAMSVLVNWDGVAALAVAQAIGATSIRVEHGYFGADIGAWGVIQSQCYEVTRFRRLIGAQDIAILADVYEPHRASFVDIPLDQSASWAIEEGGADGAYVTGHSTDDLLARVVEVRKGAGGAPVLAGGGVTAQNVATVLKHVDGFVVGRSIKGGSVRNAVDPGQARDFMAAVTRARQAG